MSSFPAEVLKSCELSQCGVAVMKTNGVPAVLLPRLPSWLSLPGRGCTIQELTSTSSTQMHCRTRAWSQDLMSEQTASAIVIGLHDETLA